MQSSHLKTISILVVSVACVVVAEEVKWHEANCPGTEGSQVTDALCCKDKHCFNLSTERACETDDTCRWSRRAGKCRPNRDVENNVCCKASDSAMRSNWCAAVTKGECPIDFQVRRGCCSSKQSKWNNVLRVSNPNMVCCNTPCDQCAKKRGCARSEHCRDKPVAGINERSFGGQYNPYSYNPAYYGFSDLYLPQSYPFTYGKQYFTGLEFPFGGYGKEHKKKKSNKHDPKDKKDDDDDDDEHENKVEEITVDDVIEALTEALKNDNDVFESSYEINSDPWFGKQTDRGPWGGIKLKDPRFFIDAIYDGKKSHRYDPYSYAFPGYGYPSHGSYGYPSHGRHRPGYGFSGIGGHYQSHNYPGYGYSSTQSTYGPSHGGGYQ